MGVKAIPPRNLWAAVSHVALSCPNWLRIAMGLFAVVAPVVCHLAVAVVEKSPWSYG